MPIVPDFWLGGGADSGLYTTIGNWNQPWRNIVFRGERFTWSKDVEFRKFLELPSRGKAQFELALSSYEQADRDLLESRGWSVRHGLDVSTDIESYRSYLLGSRGEFTVAKDQNVRLKSGWFSDRSAAYLAAGRPVVTQDTGFGCALPTGEGLFAFETMDDIVAAIEAIETDYARARRAAFDVAREYFDAQLVLGQMLEEMGVSLPGERARAPFRVAADARLSVVSRRPTTLTASTVEAVLERPIPVYGRRPPAGPCPRGLGRRRRWPTACPFTRLCLESLLVDSGELDLEVVVVDNSSSDGTGEYLRELAERDSRVRVVRNERNRGFAPAVNQGARRRHRLHPGRVEQRHDHARRARSSGSLAHLERPDAGRGRRRHERGRQRSRGRHRLPDAGRAGAVRRRPSVGSTPACASTSTSRRSSAPRSGATSGNGWAPSTNSSNWACSRTTTTLSACAAAGLRVLAAEDVFVHHFGEASFGHLFESGERSRIFEENKRRYEEKWGVTLGAARPAAQRVVPRPGRPDP